MARGKWRLSGSDPDLRGNPAHTVVPISTGATRYGIAGYTTPPLRRRLLVRVTIHAAAAVLILALCAAPVNAQAVDRPTMFLVMGGDMLALGELTHSEAGIQQGSAREANPLLGGHTNRGGTARRWVLKSAGQAISTYAILRTSRTNPDDPHRRRKIWMARAAAMAKVAFNGYILSRALDYQGDGRDPSGER